MINSYSSTKRSQCQICGKFGHIAIYCWHRYGIDAQSNAFANHSQFFNADTIDITSSILRTPSAMVSR